MSTCQLHSVRPASTPLPLSSPRMNSPRRSGVLFAPFAGIQPDGHTLNINEDIVPIGSESPPPVDGVVQLARPLASLVSTLPDH